MNEETTVSGKLKHHTSQNVYYPEGYYYVDLGDGTTIPILREAIAELQPADLIAMAAHLKKMRGGK